MTKYNIKNNFAKQIQDLIKDRRDRIKQMQSYPGFRGRTGVIA